MVPLRFLLARPLTLAVGDCWHETFGDPAPDRTPLTAVVVGDDKTRTVIYVEHLRGWQVNGGIGSDKCDLDIAPSIWLNQGHGSDHGEWHGFIQRGHVVSC